MMTPWQPHKDLAFQKALNLLNSHVPVAIPTETVYGLAAKFDDTEAIKEVFRLKNRPLDNPLIIHISDLAQLPNIISQNLSPFKKLIDQFWPGPLTLIFKANMATVPSEVRAGLDTVAVRMPNHPKALALIDKIGPLVAPSANKSGYPSPTSAAHVLSDYNGSVFVLDGGSCSKGLESTILDVHQEENLQILRPGVLGWKEFEVLGYQATSTVNALESAPINRAPGMKHRHYAPKAEVCWITTLKELPKSALTSLVISVNALSATDLTHLPKSIYLKEYKGDFTKFASSIYADFREADINGYDRIYILTWPINEHNPTEIALINRIEKAVSRA